MLIAFPRNFEAMVLLFFFERRDISLPVNNKLYETYC